MTRYESGIVGTCGALVYCLFFRCGVYSKLCSHISFCFRGKGKGQSELCLFMCVNCGYCFLQLPDQDESSSDAAVSPCLVLDMCLVSPPACAESCGVTCLVAFCMAHIGCMLPGTLLCFDIYCRPSSTTAVSLPGPRVLGAAAPTAAARGHKHWPLPSAAAGDCSLSHHPSGDWGRGQ